MDAKTLDDIESLGLLVYFWKCSKTWDQKRKIHELIRSSYGVGSNLDYRKYVSPNYDCVYGSVCICGRMFLEETSRLRLHCSECRGTSEIPDPYYFQGIPALYVELAIVKGIELYAKRTLRSTDQSTRHRFGSAS